jgi:hypothetical protein
MSRSIFGWSLPPGCTLRDIEGSPEIPQLRCNQCNGFLPTKVERVEHGQNSQHCDGKIKSYECEYNEGLINILGEEYRGKTYKIYYSCDGDEVDENTKDHLPHDILVSLWSKEFRTCKKCGHENIT